MRALIFSLFILISVTVQAQTADRKSIADTCDKVMQLIQVGKYKEAMQIVKRNSVMKEEGLADLATNMGDQLPKVGAVYGKVMGSQFVKERTISDFLFKRLYVLQFEKYYLKFSFTVYHGSAGWTMTAINYNEDIEELY